MKGNAFTHVVDIVDVDMTSMQLLLVLVSEEDVITLHYVVECNWTHGYPGNKVVLGKYFAIIGMPGSNIVVYVIFFVPSFEIF